jgi:ribonuclease-3
MVSGTQVPSSRIQALWPNKWSVFITVIVDGMECGAGFATTKKQAEQNAAEIVLKTDPRFKNKKIPVSNGKTDTGTPCG